ncbi:MAG: DinB family protein [Chitinophagaceae bacterium]
MELYLRQMEQLISGGSWQGESFREKLKNIKEQDFFRQPIESIHSIGEMIWHCIYWKTVLLERFKGNENYRDETVHAFNFRKRDDLMKAGMQQLLDLFYTTSEEIMLVLKTKDDHFLAEKNSSGIIMEFYVEGIVQHDIYHLGQIGLVQKMLALNK